MLLGFTRDATPSPPHISGPKPLPATTRVPVVTAGAVAGAAGAGAGSFKQQQQQQQQQQQAPKHDLAPVKPPIGSALHRRSLDTSAADRGGHAAGHSRSRAPCHYNAAGAALKPPLVGSHRRASQSCCSDGPAASLVSSSSLSSSSQGLRQRPAGEPCGNRRPVWPPAPPIQGNSSHHYAEAQRRGDLAALSKAEWQLRSRQAGRAAPSGGR